MKKKRTHELTLASIVAVLTVLICSLMPLAARAEGSASGFMVAARSDADIDTLVGQMLAAELCAESDFVGFEQQFLLQVDVAECASGLIARGGQVVVVLDGSEFHREQVLFS